MILKDYSKLFASTIVICFITVHQGLEVTVYKSILRI